MRWAGTRETVMARDTFHQGDWVVYRRHKNARRPGPRAQQLRPSSKGDTYQYVVEKIWVVADVLANGKVQCRTRRGKTRVVDADDPQLRRASFWDRIRYRGRFMEISRA